MISTIKNSVLKWEETIIPTITMWTQGWHDIPEEYIPSNKTILFCQLRNWSESDMNGAPVLASWKYIKGQGGETFKNVRIRWFYYE